MRSGSDSQSACTTIQVGSMQSDLHAIALEIFQFCANNGIELKLQWIPRTEIERADYISRIIDIDDWQILANCFMSLEESWGFIQWIVLLVIIIRFASLSLDFGTKVVAGENCLVVPPVYFVFKVSVRVSLEIVKGKRSLSF